MNTTTFYAGAPKAQPNWPYPWLSLLHIKIGRYLELSDRSHKNVELGLISIAST